MKWQPWYPRYERYPNAQVYDIYLYYNFPVCFIMHIGKYSDSFHTKHWDTHNVHNNGPNTFRCRRKFLLSNDHLWKVVFVLTAAANQIRSQKIDFFDFFWMFLFSIRCSRFSSFFDSFINLLQNIDLKKAICYSVYSVCTTFLFLWQCCYSFISNFTFNALYYYLHWCMFVAIFIFCFVFFFLLLIFFFSAPLLCFTFIRHFELCAVCIQIHSPLLLNYYYTNLRWTSSSDRQVS